MYIVYDENSFCDMLRKYRIDKEYSQVSFAKKIGVSRQAVNEWESGKYIPTLDKLRKISLLLNWNIEEIEMLIKNK